MEKPRIRRLLFVSHSADRSGAPLFLLNFMRWIRANKADTEIDILLKAAGELTPDYAAQGNIMMWTLDGNMFVRQLDNRKLWGRRRTSFVNNSVFAQLHQKRLLNSIESRAYDLVFVNSFASSELVPILASVSRAPIICRAPELRSVVYDFCGVDRVKEALPHVTTFIAVSMAVRHFMESDLKIAPDRIKKIPGFYRPVNMTPQSKKAIRERLGIPRDAFLVCGCGSISWRKGADLFIQIAAEILRCPSVHDTHFIWIGGEMGSAFHRELSHDLANLGFEKRINFVGSIVDPQGYFQASDLFALTSREDPFPLVALEAANAGLPIVCFDGPVGTGEFVSDGAGIVVPYLSTVAFSNAIIGLIKNKNQLRVFGEQARLSVSRYSYDRICSRLYDLIEKTIAGSPAKGPEPLSKSSERHLATRGGR